MIPFGDEQPRRPEEKGPFVLRLYVSMKGPVQREPSPTSAPSAKTICLITIR